MAEKRYYDEHDAEQILRIASKKGSMQHGAMSHEQLLAAASELGISPETVEEAEQEYRLVQAEESERAEFHKKALQDFWAHFVSYLIVNAGLIAFDLFSDGRLNWAFWPIAGWGIAIAFHAYGTFARNSDDYQSEFEKWRKKKLRRARRGRESDHDDIDDVLDEIAEELDIKLEKIAAIKELRDTTGMGLKEAKEAVEDYLEERH